jgi:TonB family protein
MKRIYVLFLLPILFYSCSQKQNIEVISNLSDQYPSLSEFGKVETTVIKEQNSIIIGKDFGHVINSLELKGNNLNLEYMLCVNEKGRIEKVLVLKSGNTDILSELLPYMENWQFEILQKEGNASKYRVDWIVAFNKNEQGKFDLASSSLPIPVEKNGEQFFSSAEEMPMPVGGILAIQQNIKYPELAKRANIQGRVFVKALVDKNGDVVHTEIIRGIGGGCNESAMEAVKATKFLPARAQGKPVNAQVIVPILFKLQ